MNVQPGTSRWTDVFGDAVARSKDRCSARVLTADLDALYAGFPGGLVMPCLEPVMTMLAGDEGDEETRGRSVLSPLRSGLVCVVNMAEGGHVLDHAEEVYGEDLGEVIGI